MINNDALVAEMVVRLCDLAGPAGGGARPEPPASLCGGGQPHVGQDSVLQLTGSAAHRHCCSGARAQR